MAFPKKIKLPVAVNSRSNQDIGGQHVTTSDFMQLNIAYAQELVPGQSLKINHELFTRLEPLAVPTFGRADIQTRAFWVPFRTVFPGWNDFITDTPHVFNNSLSAIIANVPLITNSVLVEYLSSTVASEEATSSHCDFSYINSLGTTFYRRLKPVGRFAYKILRSLGYAPLMDDRIVKTYSAMPLLCLFRAYCDYYYPSQYAHTDAMQMFIGLFTKNDNPSTTSSYIVSGQLINAFNLMFRVAYDVDYFTGAWDQPSGPNNGLSSSFSIKDATVESDNSVTSYTDNSIAGNTPIIENDNDGFITNVSHYLLDALHSLSDYMKRHQIVGARALDRYLSRFGIKLPAEKMNRSVLVNSYSQTIQFGDVTATSDTSEQGGAPLGAYAGKGLSFGKGYTEFDTNGEYGMFIIISTIIPKTNYYQGINRQILHQTKLDFFTPEFDALGTQAISSMEVYTPFHTYAGLGDYKDQVFGFVPRYGEYKTGRSLITGDYILPSLNTGKDSWTLFRDVSSIVGSNLTNVVHDFDFVTSADSSQYNRIFWNTESSADHFNIIHNLDIESSFPGKSLYDDYEFKDEDKSNKVTVDVGGTTVN